VPRAVAGSGRCWFYFVDFPVNRELSRALYWSSSGRFVLLVSFCVGDVFGLYRGDLCDHLGERGDARLCCSRHGV
jgi:hypothetical protein